MKKYEFTDEVKEYPGVCLKRIKALRDINGVCKKGDLGGFIENEKNLNVSGNAWVYGNAQVYGDAWVYGDAQVYGGARVYGDAQVESIRDIICIGPIGSRNAYTTFLRNKDLVFCGCWSGTLGGFEKRVKETHKGNTHYLNEYLGAIRYIKSLK